jgi:hypothetical protein
LCACAWTSCRRCKSLLLWIEAHRNPRSGLVGILLAHGVKFLYFQRSGPFAGLQCDSSLECTAGFDLLNRFSGPTASRFSNDQIWRVICIKLKKVKLINIVTEIRIRVKCMTTRCFTIKPRVQVNNMSQIWFETVFLNFT